MKRYIASLLLAAVLAHGAVSRAAPCDSVVRIPSHGASGTVIATAEGKTWILSCGHAFVGDDRFKPIQLDIAAVTPGQPLRVGVDLVDVDYQADLSLILLHAGPLPFATGVAPRGYRPGQQIISCGYDSMKIPETVRPATVLHVNDGITFTREIPWPGRSGGGLIDEEKNLIFGVVQGYELDGPREGMYVAHEVICDFLEKRGWKNRDGTQPAPVARIPPPAVQEYSGRQGQPQVQEYRFSPQQLQPQQMPMLSLPPGGNCFAPGGT